jgi:hypothetical protein
LWSGGTILLVVLVVVVLLLLLIMPEHVFSYYATIENCWRLT